MILFIGVNTWKFLTLCDYLTVRLSTFLIIWSYYISINSLSSWFQFALLVSFFWIYSNRLSKKSFVFFFYNDYIMIYGIYLETHYYSLYYKNTIEYFGHIIIEPGLMSRYFWTWMRIRPWNNIRLASVSKSNLFFISLLFASFHFIWVNLIRTIS